MSLEQLPVKQPRLLVVEDSADLTTIWGALFEHSGIPARFCDSGTAALSILESSYEPDIVITDYYLPDFNGLELVRQVQTRSRNVRCMLLTGHRDESFLETVARDQIPCIRKPIRFSHLLSEVLRVAENGRREDKA